MKLNCNFLGGGGGGARGCKTKNLLWGEYGYFLKLHNSDQTCITTIKIQAQKLRKNDGEKKTVSFSKNIFFDKFS